MYEVVHYPDITPNSDGWLEERKINTFNASNFHVKIIGTGHKIRKGQKIVADRTAAFETGAVAYQDVPTQYVIDNFFIPGHEAEALMWNFLDNEDVFPRPVYRKMVSPDGDITIGVTPDGLFRINENEADIPIEVKTQIRKHWKNHTIPETTVTQNLLQAISQYSEFGYIIRITNATPDSFTFDLYHLHYDTARYTDDLIRFIENISMDKAYVAPKELVTPGNFYVKTMAYVEYIVLNHTRSHEEICKAMSVLMYQMHEDLY